VTLEHIAGMPPALHVALTEFCKSHLDQQLCHSSDEGGSCHPKDAENKALNLFRMAADTTPAYRSFLTAQGCSSPDTVSSFADVPVTTKLNYFSESAYPLDQRCQGGTLASADFIHQSSGSTSGCPTLWPRSTHDELSVAARFEQIFMDGFMAHKKTTLAVVAFPLGAWVGGLFTVQVLKDLTIKGTVFPLKRIYK